jgi:hypothetical protein
MIMLKSDDPGAPFEFDLERWRSGSHHHPTFPRLAPRRIVASPPTPSLYMSRSPEHNGQIPRSP